LYDLVAFKQQDNNTAVGHNAPITNTNS